MAARLRSRSERCDVRACSLLLFALCSLAAPAVFADDCTRPTDAGGDALGYKYGSATVRSFGNASGLVWYTSHAAMRYRASNLGRGDSPAAAMAVVPLDSTSSWCT